METAFHLLASTCLLATEMKFSKYSVVSVISNWLYNSERKPGNAGNCQLFEDVDFHFKLSKTLFPYAKTMMIRLSISI